MGRLLASFKKEQSISSEIKTNMEKGNGVGVPIQRSESVKLLGSPEDLLDLLITDVKEKEWAIDLLVKESPKHKQVLSTLLASRLFKLVHEEEKSSVKKSIAQQEATMPKSTENEAIVYAMCMQVIEWAISAKSK
jgi:hypothetical protein